MELKLKSTGSTNEFISWLKGFKDIESSLLLEVDLKTNEFIAKSFPAEKSVVKYSKIDFETAGYEFVYLKDNQGNDIEELTETSENRIKVGLLNILPKVINVTNMFSQTDHDLIIEFNLCNNVVYATYPQTDNANSVKEYQGMFLKLISKSLTMSVRCSEISKNFQKCTDEVFLTKACYIGNPATYEISTETLSNLSKITALFSSDERDKIKFYSKEVDGHVALFAYDESNGSYDYLLGYYVSGSSEKTAVIIFKENFLNATKGLSEEVINLTLDTAGASRILIEGGSSKIVVSAVRFS